MDYSLCTIWVEEFCLFVWLFGCSFVRSFVCLLALNVFIPMYVCIFTMGTMVINPVRLAALLCFALRCSASTFLSPDVRSLA